MHRKKSSIAPEWWDYTTLPRELVDEVSRLNVSALGKLSRTGFNVVIHDSLEEFYLAQALEYTSCWSKSTDDNPIGICGPIGPTEQLPLVAKIVNSMGLDIRSAHFWAMDEWIVGAKEVSVRHPLSFERANRELWYNRIERSLRMPDSHLHFPKADTNAYQRTWNCGVKCSIMQGGQGDVKHWAFNDPFPRKGKFINNPPSPSEFRKLATRVVNLHPLTIAQNARTSGGGNISIVPTQAVSVGPVETWMSDSVSIWQAGMHDNPFGQRLTAFMISKRIVDTSVPLSLLADHPNVNFHYLRGGIGTCSVIMH